MKIAITTDTYWPRINGVTVSVDTFQREFWKKGNEAYVFAPRYNKNKETDKRIFRLKAMGLFFSPEDRLTLPWAKTEMFRRLDEIKPDVIHIQTEFTTYLLARDYCRMRKIPLVMTCHTYFEQYINYYLPFLPKKWARALARKITMRVYNSVDRIICPTSLMRDVLVGYGVKKPMEIIPTGIAPEDFKGVSKEKEKSSSFLYKEYPKIKGKKLLLFVGRIGQEKNVSFLLEVVKRLKKDFPDIILLYAGDGPYMNGLRKKIKKEGLNQNVVLLGYIDRKLIKHVYALADVFTFPSMTETQGLVTTEAMLCGTPVVAIDRMGTSEIMKGGKGGFLVNDNADEFSAKVKLLLQDEKLYAKKSREALECSRKWPVSNIEADRIINVYKSAMKTKK